MKSLTRVLMALVVAAVAITGVFIVGKSVADQQRELAANREAAQQYNQTVPVPTGTPAEAEAPPITLTPTEGEQLRVHFSGDSLSEGWYASEEDLGFRPIVQRALEEQAAVEFTGTYRAGDRVQDIAAGFDIPEGMDLAIVELGTNDVTKETDPELFREQYSSYLGNVVTASPDAQLICLGVFAFPNEAAQLIDTHISSECANRGGTYIELKDLFRDESLRGPVGAQTWLGPADEGHPNDAGHARIAEMILSRIEVTS